MKPLRTTTYESFNARSKRPREVAETFVPPQSFRTLLTNTHTVVIGPRGSGKTTLLKMLQPEALDAWSDESRDEFPLSAGYCGSFVGTDIVWREQLDSLKANPRTAKYADVLSSGAFVTQVLRSLLRTLRYTASSEAIIFRTVLSRSAEAELVRSLADAWYATPSLPSLAGLELSLHQRAGRIGQIAEELRVGNEALASALLEAHPYLAIDVVQATDFMIEALGVLADSRPDRWAIVVDELELAPRRLRSRLFRDLRSRSSDERILFKFSLTPQTEGLASDITPDAPQLGQDYEIVHLTYPHKVEGYVFSRNLVESMLSRIRADDWPASRVFGRSEFDSGRREGVEFRAEYRAPNGAGYKRLTSLAAKDRSFSAFVQEHGLDLERLTELTDGRRAADVRKARYIAAVRDTFRQPDGSKTTLRTVKNPVVYAGETNFYALCEGNPRLLIGVVLSLMNAGQLERRDVRRNVQVRQYFEAADRFRNRLRTVPFAPDTRRPAKDGVLSLLDVIGAYFADRVLRDPFNIDPPLSFSVGREIPEHVHAALVDALNLGAIIYMREKGDPELIDKLYGRRFRLCYLLAMWHKLPLIATRPISLSSILSTSAVSPPLQPVLPLENE